VQPLAALRSAPHSLASRYSVQADAKPYVIYQFTQWAVKLKEVELFKT